MVLTPKTGEGTTVKAFTFVPSAVHVEHANNFSRADRYTVPDELKAHIEGSTFCFTLAEVERRLSEFDRDGEQITPGTVYLTSTCDAFLVDGYLRHAAWLLAEVRYLANGFVWANTDAQGKRLEIPEADLENVPADNVHIVTAEYRHKLDTLTQLLSQCKRGLNLFKSQKIRKPSANDWARLRRRNYSENNTRKELTPIDRAYFGQRIIAAAKRADPELTEKQYKTIAADEMGIAPRSLDRLLACLAYDPATQDKLHSGDLSMGQAEKLGRQQGKGTHKGKRPGTPHTNMRRAFSNIDEREPPNCALDSYQLLQFGKSIAGIDIVDSEGEKVEIAADVQQWVDWLDMSQG